MRVTRNQMCSIFVSASTVAVLATVVALLRRFDQLRKPSIAISATIAGATGTVAAVSGCWLRRHDRAKGNAFGVVSPGVQGPAVQGPAAQGEKSCGAYPQLLAKLCKGGAQLRDKTPQAARELLAGLLKEHREGGRQISPHSVANVEGDLAVLDAFIRGEALVLSDVDDSLADGAPPALDLCAPWDTNALVAAQFNEDLMANMPGDLFYYLPDIALAVVKLRIPRYEGSDTTFADKRLPSCKKLEEVLQKYAVKPASFAEVRAYAEGVVTAPGARSEWNLDAHQSLITEIDAAQAAIKDSH